MARRSSLVIPHPSHIPVLLAETLETLAPEPGETVLDCTAGLGGHAEALARRVGPDGCVVLCDQDPGNLVRAAARLAAIPDALRPREVRTIPGSFAQAPRTLRQWGVGADVVLADLGFSSNQMDDPNRGLSFMREGPLDMRLNPSAPVTAAELVATLSERELAEILRDLGEEPAARRIAQKIVLSRKIEPIQTTTQLAEIVRSVVPRIPGTIDPSTRTFQALRIAVNDELGALAVLLEAVERAAVGPAGSWLAPGARVGVISFHSLEDRLVKQSFARVTQQGRAENVGPKPPITPGDAEVQTNPRSRSAKLRVVRLAMAS